jgi:hypothetical protein
MKDQTVAGDVTGTVNQDLENLNASMNRTGYAGRFQVGARGETPAELKNFDQLKMEMERKAKEDPLYAEMLSKDPRFAELQATRQTNKDESAKRVEEQKTTNAQKRIDDLTANADHALSILATNPFDPIATQKHQWAVQQLKQLGVDYVVPKARGGGIGTSQNGLAAGGTQQGGIGTSQQGLSAAPSQQGGIGTSKQGLVATSPGKITPDNVGGTAAAIGAIDPGTGAIINAVGGAFTSENFGKGTVTEAPDYGSNRNKNHADPNTVVQDRDGTGSKSYSEIASQLGNGATADDIAYLISQGYGYQEDDEFRLVNPQGDYLEDTYDRPEVGNIVQTAKNAINQQRGDADLAEKDALEQASYQDLKKLVDEPINLEAVKAGYDKTIADARKVAARNKALTLKSMQETAARNGLSVNQLVGQSSETGYAIDSQNQLQETMLNLQKEMAIAQESIRQHEAKINLAQQMYNRATNRRDQQEALNIMQAAKIEADAANARAAELQAEANSPSLGMTLAKIGVGVGGAILAPYTGGASLAASGAILGGMGAVEAANASNSGATAWRNYNQPAPGYAPQAQAVNFNPVGVAGPGSFQYGTGYAPGSQGMSLGLGQLSSPMLGIQGG